MAILGNSIKHEELSMYFVEHNGVTKFNEIK